LSKSDGKTKAWKRQQVMKPQDLALFLGSTIVVALIEGLRQ
jgi:hypothetical protein